MGVTEVTARLIEYLRERLRLTKEHVLRHTGGRMPRMYPLHILYLSVVPYPTEPEFDDSGLMKEIEALREIWDNESRNDTYLDIYIELYERERIRYDPYASLIGAPAFY
jgi:hypothetical protein